MSMRKTKLKGVYWVNIYLNKADGNIKEYDKIPEDRDKWDTSSNKVFDDVPRNRIIRGKGTSYVNRTLFDAPHDPPTL